MSEETIRLIIADDQPMFAEGLKYVLESRADDIEVIAIVPDGAAAVAATEANKPDIVLMDIRMPVMDGVEATRRIQEIHPEVKVLVLTTFSDDEYVHSSLRNGAVGYLLKNRPPLELIVSIRAVKRGILQIDPEIAETLFREHEPLDKEDVEFAHDLESLTPREIDVLELLIEALDNKQIAQKLFVAEQTIRNHVSVIYSKLDIENRMQILQHIDNIKSFLRRRSPNQ